MKKKKKKKERKKDIKIGMCFTHLCIHTCKHYAIAL